MIRDAYEATQLSTFLGPQRDCIDPTGEQTALVIRVIAVVAVYSE
jgi:hypothetical protein